MTRALLALGLGVAFGFVLSAAGFTSIDEVHRMFTLGDARLFLTFGGACALLAAAWLAAARVVGPLWARRIRHPGLVPGSVVFGLGWAVTGACPAVIFAQLGEGQWLALWSLAGVVAGNALFGAVRARGSSRGRRGAASLISV